MEIPQDFNHPFYNRLKNEVRGMLAGSLGNTSFSEEGTIARIRNIQGQEAGYSDELVRSMPEWKKKFPAKEVSVAPQREETIVREGIAAPVEDQEELKKAREEEELERLIKEEELKNDDVQEKK